MNQTRPIWAEVARSRIVHNYRVLRHLAGADVDLLAVIKADAYGHGLAACAQALADEGGRWFGVTCVEEAVALRDIFDDRTSQGTSNLAPHILTLSSLCPGEADAVIDYALTPVVWDPAHLDLLCAAATRRGLAPGTLRIHLEIDTGMSRQGVQPQNLAALLDRFIRESPLRIEAVMTHFHSPDDRQFTRDQIRRFGDAVEILTNCGIRPEFFSAGSSGDLLNASTTEVTDLARRHGARRMMRAGIALYGYSPIGRDSHGLRPVLDWKTRVISLRDIDAGATAGYGATFLATRPTRLALVPVGYADGLSRALSNRGSVLVRGRRAPIAGRVSMDQTMVDVTDIPGVVPGDEVVLIGEQGSERITAADMAQLTGTIAYEVLCAITARVPRIVVD